MDNRNCYGEDRTDKQKTKCGTSNKGKDRTDKQKAADITRGEKNKIREQLFEAKADGLVQEAIARHENEERKKEAAKAQRSIKLKYNKKTMAEKMDHNIKALLEELVDACNPGGLLKVDWANKESRGIRQSQQANIRAFIEIINKLKDLKEKLADEILMEKEGETISADILQLVDDANKNLSQAGYSDKIK